MKTDSDSFDPSASSEEVQAPPSAGPSRAEHLAWCKERALAYTDAGDVQGAFASMASDLNKHPGTANHIGVELGLMQLMGGMLSSPAQMRHFIEGFN